jgi:hypothetical protein
MSQFELRNGRQDWKADPQARCSEARRDVTLVRHWRARPASGRTPQAFIRLVAEAESILTAELGMWVEEMKEALRELHDRHFQENAIKRT